MTRSKKTPPLALFGFYFLLVFVFGTIPAGILGTSPTTAAQHPQCSSAHVVAMSLLMSIHLVAACLRAAKTRYGTTLANVDFLHGPAESLLTITNLLIGEPVGTGQPWAQCCCITHYSYLAAGLDTAAEYMMRHLQCWASEGRSFRQNRHSRQLTHKQTQARGCSRAEWAEKMPQKCHDAHGAMTTLMWKPRLRKRRQLVL